MKNLKHILLFIITFSSTIVTDINAQNFADKEYYLIDSLDLDALSEQDKTSIDTYLKEYHNAKDDTSRVKAIRNICSNMVHHDNEKYQWFEYHLISKSLESGPTDKKVKETLTYFLADALGKIAQMYSYIGDITLALEYNQKSLEAREEVNDIEGKAIAYNNFGTFYLGQGDIPLALDYFEKSLKILEEYDNKEGMASCYNNIGTIHLNQGSLPLALEYFKKSIKNYEAIGFKRGVAYTNLNIGSIYRTQKKLTLALDYYQKSLKTTEEIGDKPGMAYSNSNIGSIYQKQGNIPLALDYFQKSLILMEELGNKPGMAASLAKIAKLKVEIGDFNGALIFGEKGLKYAKETENIRYIEVSAIQLSKAYEKLMQPKKALEMYKLSITMRDSLNNKATQKATAEQQAKYEYEKQKVLDDAEHDKLLAIEQEAKAKQKVITYATAGGLGLVAIFLIFVFNRLQVTRKQKIVIEEQRDIVEEAHKEIRDSITYAERIQRSFLATDELLNNNLKDYFVFFQPKDVVSGDFYWAGKLANNNFAVLNADSTGHGVPGAIMSILNISSIEKAVESGLLKPSEIFNHTRNTIIERLSKDGSEGGGKDGMDASIISFDFDNNKFSYTAAQNPIWIIRGGELIEIKPEKMPIGKHENDATPFIGGEFDTQKGDVVYTITDGFQDQFGGDKGKKFMVKPFKTLLLSIAQLPMQEQKEILSKKFTTWQGEEEQVDDVCVIGVRV